MKKFIFGIASVFVIAILATAFGNNPDSKKIKIGSQFPSIVLTNTYTTISPADNGSQHFTLITLWTGRDAQSRLACTEYNNFFKLNPEAASKIDYAAINFDRSRTLRDEIIRIDGLDANTQFEADNITAMTLGDALDLDLGMGSMLISPEGKVVAFNPTVERLKALID